MHFEYAVEPRVIGSSWETFRYLIEQFGFDKGRLISEFPKHWLGDVNKATSGFLPIQKARATELLRQAKKNKVVKCNRPYNANAGNWLYNALSEHRRLPFRAIVAAENPRHDEAVLLADEIDELHPLMNVSHDGAVPRDAASLSRALKAMLRFGSQILFIDPFYDPFNMRYKNTFRECLKIVRTENPEAVCEIHYRYHENKPANDDLRREAMHLFPGVVPDEMRVTIFCWRQKRGGTDFHARYLLTDQGGIGIDAGFSAEGRHQNTDMYLMTFQLSQEKLKQFSRHATDYELVEPVIRVDGAGRVEIV
jgi:hypothetical protein